MLHPENGKGPVDDRYTDADGRPSERYVLSDKLWTYLQAYAAKPRIITPGSRDFQ